MELIERPDPRAIAYLASIRYLDFKADCIQEAIKDGDEKPPTEKDIKTWFSNLQQYCATNIKTKCITKRIYSYSQNTPAGLGGRLYSGGSMQGIWNKYRGLLMRGRATDIDMVNAHPVILRYICKKHTIACPELEYYINNRDDILAQWSIKKKGKNAYLVNTNNEKYKAPTGETPEVCSGLRRYATENKKIQKAIVELPDYKDHIETIAEDRTWNRNGSGMNKVLCFYENIIVQHAMHVVNARGLETGVIMFDGCMPYGDHYADTGLLEEIQTYVESQMPNLNMKWSYKEHCNEIQIPADFDEKKAEEQIEYIPTKPLEVAQYIINLLPDQLMRKQKELYMFSNHRWISGNDAECALAKYLYTTIYPDLKLKLELQGGEDTKKRIGELDKYIKINSSSMIIKKVSELLPISDAVFDTNPFLLGFENGVLDLKLFSNGQEPWFRKAEPKDYVSMSVGYDYFVPKEEDPMIEVRDELDTFFAAVMPKEADHLLLMQTLASCLDGIGYEKFIMMNGGGGNGKSICFNLMSEVLGGYYITAKNAVVKEVSKANESSSDVHLLKGKRMICFEELGDLDNNVMKQFTGGVRITARPLYGNPEQFYLAGTTLGTFNERPDIKNMSGGNSDHRRYVDVFWSVCFTNDEAKIGTTEIVKKQQITYQQANNKYSSVEWRTKVKIGMLWRLLYYYRESFNKKTNCIDFTVPQEALDRTADFINDQNHFHRIFHECYEVAPENTDQIKIVRIWENIQHHPSYILLSGKEKRRFGRKAFDEWIEKTFTIQQDTSYVKYITGLSGH